MLNHPGPPADPESLICDAEAFHARATAGEFTGAEPLLADLKRAASPLGRAWCSAVHAQVWLAFPELAELPGYAEMASFVGAEPAVRRVATTAAYDWALASLLEFDVRELERRTELLARLAADETSVELVLARAWCALLAGDALSDALEQTRKLATAGGKARAVIELQAIRALAALHAGDDATGLDLARRASLMARAEGIPQAEFVAYLTLARARRHARQVHLSLRIVEALQGVLTKPWRRWLSWEAAFAAGAQPRAGSRAEPSDLAPLFSTAAAGDRRALLERAQALAERAGRGLFGRELIDLVAALVPDSRAASLELEKWRDGDTVLIPSALHGFMSRPDHEEGDTAAAYVVVAPAERGRRILHLGLPLVGEHVVRLRQSRRAQGRVETLLAIVALAGPEGVVEADCFRQAYGFAYAADVHRGVFDVLLHRARAAIEPHAELERSQGRLYFRARGPLLLPDPQVSERMTDRVLRLLAQRGSASARQAASDLGVSLRAVQTALNELSSHGACAAQREGRHVAYVVEDTVFSEPTLRLRREDL